MTTTTARDCLVEEDQKQTHGMLVRLLAGRADAAMKGEAPYVARAPGDVERLGHNTQNRPLGASERAKPRAHTESTPTSGDEKGYRRPFCFLPHPKHPRVGM